MVNPKVCRVLLVGLSILILCGSGLLAQSTSSITGRVLDPSAAVIPGVEVSVTNNATEERRIALTNDSGHFRVSNLVPGLYRVRAALEGFKTAESAVEVTVGEIKSVTLRLEVGAIGEVVTVTDAVATVEVEQGRVSSLVDEKRVKDLPLNGRNVFQLMQLTPGAVNTTSTVFEPGQSTNVNGARANFNGFWMDGVTSKGLSGGTGAGDTAGTTPNLEAIQEFRIETLNFSAEFGNSVGSVVNVVSKSGGNKFHGSVYEFHRNDNVDAREFFDGASKPEFKQNQFGFSIGGPIVKDSTFFFGSYEGTRIRTGESSLGTFESQAWGNYMIANGAPVARFLYGNYPARALSTIDFTVGEYLTEFGYTGDGSQASVDAFLGSTFGSAPGALGANTPMVGETTFFTPDSSDNDGLSIRIDQEFGDNDKIYGRYFLNNSDGQVVDPRPAFNSPSISRNHQLAFNWTHVFSPTMVNEARVGLTRNLGDIFAGTPGVPLIAESGSGVSSFGAYNGYPQIFHENIFTYADTLSINKGDHGLKLGGELRRNQENSEFNVGRPSYYFFDLVALGMDNPYLEVGGVDPTLGGGSCVTTDCLSGGELASNFRGWRGTEIGLFINDDWKIKDNLTLNLGLRWDWYGRLTEVQNRATAFDLTRGGNNLFERVANAAFIGPVDSLSADDYNNFAPRLGLAWDPFGDGKTSVRSGFGVAYQSGIFNPLANSRWNKPFYSFNILIPIVGLGNSIFYGPQDGSPVRADGANNNPGGRNFAGNIIAYDGSNPNLAFLSGIPNPNQRDPYVMSFFLGVQREFLRDTTFEVNYVGTLGRKLIRAENFNRFPGDLLGATNPATGGDTGDTNLNRINSNEGTLRFWENSVNSSYHSLQVQLNRRYSKGFAVNANYTWAKSLDVRSTWHSGATSSNRGQEGYSTDVTNVALDYGRSVFDANHRFVINWLWDAPWFRTADSWFLRNIVGGWQFNGITSLQSGQPFTPHCSLGFTSGCDFNADGLNTDRPNALGGNSINADRLDFVNPNSGIFNIAGNTLSDRLAFFGTPAPGSNGTLGRNTFEGPGFANVDFSLFKNVAVSALGEDSKLQFRFEFFNLFNHANFFQPEPRIERTTFGRSTQAFDAREIQFGIKFIF